MRAVMFREYGPPEVLTVEDVEAPVPRADEVLIRQHATTVTSADCMMRRGDSLMGRVLLGLRGPRRRYRIMGIELAGEVVDVGAKVTRFRRGDRVFGFAGFSVGCYAQYNCLPQDASLAIMPPGLGFEEAAAIVDGGTTALFFLQDLARVQAGDRVLVLGASGSVGTSAVQVASRAGAVVTAVCSSKNADLVGSLGAARCLDYTTTDFTQLGEKYDIIFDAVGKSAFSRCRACLTDDGRYLTTVGGLGEYLQTLWTAAFGKKRSIFGMSIKKDRQLQTLKAMVEAGTFVPVIDRRYTLEQIADAHRYVETGRKRGNVVVAVQH